MPKLNKLPKGHEGYPCTYFLRPHGKKKEDFIFRMFKEDFDWFKENNVKISAEQTSDNTYIFYADVGKFVNNDPTEDPDEAIMITGLNKCPWETFHKLRKIAQNHLET